MQDCSERGVLCDCTGRTPGKPAQVMTQRVPSSNSQEARCHVMRLPPLPWASGLPRGAECTAHPKPTAGHSWLAKGCLHTHSAQAKSKNSQCGNMLELGAKGTTEQSTPQSAFIVSPQPLSLGSTIQKHSKILVLLRLTHAFRHVLKEPWA